MSAKKDDVQSFLDSFASGLASVFAPASSYPDQNAPKNVSRFRRADAELKDMAEQPKKDNAAPKNRK